MDKLKDLVFVNVQMPAQLQEKLRRLAFDLNLNRAEVVRSLIEQEYVKRYGEDNNDHLSGSSRGMGADRGLSLPKN